MWKVNLGVIKVQYLMPPALLPFYARNLTGETGYKESKVLEGAELRQQ